MTTIKRLNDKAYDEDRLSDNSVEFAVYYYADEGYEGYGNCLMYKEGKWYTHDMGHCSCYGPFEELSFASPFDSLEKAIEDLKREDWAKRDESRKTMRKKAEHFLKTKE